jgi:hypothetical protein
MIDKKGMIDMIGTVYSKLPVGEKSPLQVHFIGRLQAFSAL